MKIIVEKADSIPVQYASVEIVERKGLGHPDTLCDRIAEELSIAFSRYYQERFGRILHHNIDKCLLVGGQSKVCFGGGRVTAPIQIIVVGRAVEYVEGERIPVEEIVRETTYRCLKEHVRCLDPEKHVDVQTKIRAGSADLRATFDSAVPLANDTSIGVGFSPLTETESLVYQTEKFLNSREVKKNFPMIGEDIKIMGIRMHDWIDLTIAMAFVSSLIPSKDEYFKIKAEVLEYVSSFIRNMTTSKVTVAINTADNYEKDVVYLTVTGISAECGDDGQVGRGNRANGLITPCRPMTLEAAAGKNPLTHTGKLYNIVANEISLELSSNRDIFGAECYLVSQIGMPVTEPQIVHVKIHSTLPERILKEKAGAIINKHLTDIPRLYLGILERRYSLF